MNCMSFMTLKAPHRRQEVQDWFPWTHTEPELALPAEFVPLDPRLYLLSGREEEVEQPEIRRLNRLARAEEALEKKRKLRRQKHAEKVARLKQAQKDAKWEAWRKANPPSPDTPKPAPPVLAPRKPKPTRYPWYSLAANDHDATPDSPAARERQRREMYAKLAGKIEETNQVLLDFLRVNGHGAKLKFQSAASAWLRPNHPRLLEAYLAWREGGQHIELVGWDGEKWLVTPPVEPLVKVWARLPKDWRHPLGLSWHG